MSQTSQKRAPDVHADSIALSIGMLEAVLDGKSYDAVASDFGVTRTTVERRIKAAALVLSREVGIDGIGQDGPIYVQRLRRCRSSVAAAIARYEPQAAHSRPRSRPLSDEDIHLAMQRTKARSPCPERDVALFFMLLTTGARPLEVARLEVRDYLHADGSVRNESLMRGEVTVNGKARPLFFVNEKSRDAIDTYLMARLISGFGVTGQANFRGLDPHSRLFLTEQGNPFEIVSYGTDGQLRFLCRGVLDAYLKIFRRIGLPGVSALTIRRMVADRMFDRGATERQIGDVLGISERKSVRELLSGHRRSLQTVMQGLV